MKKNNLLVWIVLHISVVSVLISSIALYRVMKLQDTMLQITTLQNVFNQDLIDLIKLK